MSYALPKFTLLNFSHPRCSEIRRIPAPSAMPLVSKKRFMIFQNEAGYGYKIMTPPCESLYHTHWVKVVTTTVSKFAKTPATSNILATLLKDGGPERFQSERNDFFARLTELNKSGLDQMYDG